ncbi:hypothetical protein DSO57_1039028 [Entomophthora muscae]|uniref:Uncharacterized protein n=1 Tax=Entomophthora muscae TaxID=34485 RepID=A0ACC2SMU0_9FUNG|nr:hypothetical protein DSO57_1039028 [Entomophthora muscae]
MHPCYSGRPNASNFFLILKSGKDVNAKYNTIKEAELNGASILPYGKFLQKAINFFFPWNHFGSFRPNDSDDPLFSPAEFKRKEGEREKTYGERVSILCYKNFKESFPVP